MKFIDKIDFEAYVNLIFNAKHRIYLCSPGIEEELAEALVKRVNQIEIKVVIDNSEKTIRNGYGEIKGIETLKSAGIDIYECNGNLVSFIISDSEGYFLFPQSRIFNAEPQGPNAVKIDPLSLNLLLNNYFPGQSRKVKEDLFSDTTIEAIASHFENRINEYEEFGVTVEAQQLDETKYNEIKTNIKINPPLEPDLQRQVSTYTTKIQFVELKFTGGNLENHIATLPKDAVPINSVELKQLLSTKIKMFQDIKANDEYLKFLGFKKKVEELRKRYLKSITCRQGKSIIKLEEKARFLSELLQLQEEAGGLSDLLRDMLESERLKTKGLVRKELTAFFEINEPQELGKFKNVDVKKQKLEEIISEVISKIKFVEVNKLVEQISLKASFYDLTFSDFTDGKLLNEFEGKDIMKIEDLESIVSMKNAFEAKQGI